MLASYGIAREEGRFKALDDSTRPFEEEPERLRDPPISKFGVGLDEKCFKPVIKKHIHNTTGVRQFLNTADGSLKAKATLFCSKEFSD